MRRRLPLCLLAALVAASSASEPVAPRPTSRPTVVPEKVRAELRTLLKQSADLARPDFRGVAETIEQARSYARVPDKHTWQAQVGEWFVFARPDFRGEPDSWSGIYFVQKGSNLVGYYRESW